MTADELAELGQSTLVYVKAVKSDDVKATDPEELARIPDGITLYAVHFADGTPVALLDDREAAFIAARQYEMDPVSVH